MYCCFTTLEKILCLVPLVQISFDLVRQGDKPFWQEDDDEDQEDPDYHEPQVGESERLEAVPDEGNHDRSYNRAGQRPESS